MNKSIEERFCEKVEKDKDTGCWEWTSTLSRGYGQFWVDPKYVLAHRFAWIFVYGPIPIGMLVLHKCNNRKCVNPDHLYLGDHCDNMHDMVRSHPNWKKGESNNSAKLKNGDIIRIRELASSGMRQKDIGAIFGVLQNTVSRIIHKKRWAHI